MAKSPITKSVESLKHDEAKRKNIPTAEYQSVLQKEEQNPVRVEYPRNRDLDPQLVWRGKDEQDWCDLFVQAPPLYIQEKVHPKVLIDDLLRTSKVPEHDAGQLTPDLFADFNGIPHGVDKTEFYQHDQNWSNRMILGDSLQVMASLAEREGLRGKVQCIYLDPPYGIKFNSNFQWSTTSRDVKDGKVDHITREPEQVKAFRDTWRDGIHSYLTYLRDRLTVARDLLADSGSIFVQIGDENVHRVRAVMDEVFGAQNFCSQIVFRKTGGQSSTTIASVADSLLWYARKRENVKFRQPYQSKRGPEDRPPIYSWVETENLEGRRKMSSEEASGIGALDPTSRIFACDNLTSPRPANDPMFGDSRFQGVDFSPGKGTFKSDKAGLTTLGHANRLLPTKFYSRLRSLHRRFPSYSTQIASGEDTSAGGFSDDKTYVVQTNRRSFSVASS